MSKFSCLADALAVLLDEPCQVIRDEIGHDGSKIVWPDLKDPKSRRGYHIQELQDVCYKRGKLLAQIEAVSGLVPDRNHKPCMLEFKPSALERFTTYIDKNDGILLGINERGNVHAWPVFGGSGFPADCKKSISFWILTDAASPRLVSQTSNQ